MSSRVATGVALMVASLPAEAAPSRSAPAAPVTFVTLGTIGGPVPDGKRSQPANALVRGGAIYLVDAGDGTVEQMARAGLRLPAVQAVVLSHLHVDHVGGLLAIIGLRLQTEVRGVLRIYGPPGTRQLVAGLVASLQPSADAGYGLPGKPWAAPGSLVAVTELTDGQTIRIDDITVKVAQNTHYDFPAGSSEDLGFKSFSYRFEVPGRSIVYTGDTGPSPAVERLAAGADLLVSELIDVESTIDRMSRVSPDMPAGVKANMVEHLTTHHLTGRQVGHLAAQAGVKRLVVTHFAGGIEGPGAAKRAMSGIRTEFGGPVTLANDLDRF